MGPNTAPMRELLDYITQELVSNPEALTIYEEIDEKGNITFNVKADKKDLGLLIGKNGKTARAIRHLVSLLAPEPNCLVEIEFIE